MDVSFLGCVNVTYTRFNMTNIAESLYQLDRMSRLVIPVAYSCFN